MVQSDFEDFRAEAFHMKLILMDLQMQVKRMTEGMCNEIDRKLDSYF